nr:hypothetical protein [Tanacetum cinerariifolium]
TTYAVAPRGPLPPVVIREPKSGKYQSLLKVAHDLLSLQKPKKKIHADQYIFQRRVSEPTGSFRHDESPYDVLGQSVSKEESEKVVLGADEGGQDEGQAGPDPSAQAEGQMGSDAGAQDEGQAGPDPSAQAEGQMGSDADEGFTATAYPKVQENLKLTVEEQVLLEEPASSSGTLSSLQHLSKDISFGDLFFSNKPSDADKNAETEVESMMNVPIQQDLYSISLMTSSIIDLTSRPESPKRIYELEHIMANLIQVNKDIEERLDKHRARLYTLEQLDIPQQVSKARNSRKTWLKHARKKSRESPKTPHGSPRHQPPPPPPPAGPFGALGAFGASRSSQVPLPPPSSTNQESPSKGSVAPSSSKTAASAEYHAWTTDIRLRPSISLTHADLEMDKDIGPDEQAQSSNDEDIGSAHIPKVNLRQDWWKPFEEE